MICIFWPVFSVLCNNLQLRRNETDRSMAPTSVPSATSFWPNLLTDFVEEQLGDWQ